MRQRGSKKTESARIDHHPRRMLPFVHGLLESLSSERKKVPS
jgi:hypothetical protein